MKLILEPGAFRWDGTMPVLDSGGHTRYRVTGDGYRLGKRIHVRDLAGREAIYIRQVVPSLLARYDLEVYGKPVGTLIRLPEGKGYFVEELNWEIQQDSSGCHILSCAETVASCHSGDQPGTVVLDCADMKDLAVLLLMVCVLEPWR